MPWQGKRRDEAMWIRSISTCALIALLTATACGSPQVREQPAARESRGSTFVVTPGDGHKSVTLDRGDRLVVAQGPLRGHARWTLSFFPRSVLALRAGSAHSDRIEFAAVGRGKGVVVLRRAFTCGECPAGRGSKEKLAAVRPPRPATIVITVVVR
jgi:hypothetical protein